MNPIHYFISFVNSQMCGNSGKYIIHNVQDIFRKAVADKIAIGTPISWYKKCPENGGKLRVGVNDEPVKNKIA